MLPEQSQTLAGGAVGGGGAGDCVGSDAAVAGMSVGIGVFVFTAVACVFVGISLVIVGPVGEGRGVKV